MTRKRNDSKPVSLRLSPEFKQAAESLSEIHQAKNLSDYFRGLIFIDALLASGLSDLLDRPAWVTKDYGGLIRRETESLRAERRLTREKVGEETSSQLHTALSTILADAPKTVVEKVVELLTQNAGKYAR
jgi:hypothetical protein